MARKVAEEKGLAVEFILGGAEAIALPDNHVDTVSVTYTMCTIPQVAEANKEINRVLKPKGKLIFCEHGLAPDANIAKWQNRIEQMYLPSTPKFAGYNYWGTAVAG